MKIFYNFVSLKENFFKVCDIYYIEQIKKLKTMIYKKLFELQQEFKSKKDSFNTFGKYSYRNAEAMLTTLKPMLNEKGLILIFKEELVNDSFMKSTARLIEVETGEEISTECVTAIDLDLKGMSSAQSTGCTISYLRKYLMGGLFAVDEGKDADSMDTTNFNKPIKKTEDKISDILNQISECQTIEELTDLWNRLKTWTKNETIKTAFTTKKNILKNI